MRNALGLAAIVIGSSVALGFAIKKDYAEHTGRQPAITLHFQNDEGKPWSETITHSDLESFLQKHPGLTKENLEQYRNFIQRGRWMIWDVAELFDAGITPERALLYHQRFSPDNIADLHVGRVEPSVANAYDEQFRIDDILDLHLSHIAPNIANPYSSLLTADSVAGLRTGKAISDLVQHALSPEQALTYATRGFTLLQDVIDLAKAGVKPEDTDPFLALNKTYGTKLDSADIVGLIAERIPFAEVEAAAKQYKLLQAMK